MSLNIESINYTWEIITQFVCWEFCQNFRQLVENSNSETYDITEYFKNLISSMTENEDESEDTQDQMVAKFVNQLKCMKSPEEINSILKLSSKIAEKHHEFNSTMDKFSRKLKKIQHSPNFHSELQLLTNDFCISATRILPIPTLLNAASSWGQLRPKWHKSQLYHKAKEILEQKLTQDDIIPVLNLVEMDEDLWKQMSSDSDYYMFGNDLKITEKSTNGIPPVTVPLEVGDGDKRLESPHHEPVVFESHSSESEKEQDLPETSKVLVLIAENSDTSEDEMEQILPENTEGQPMDEDVEDAPPMFEISNGSISQSPIELNGTNDVRQPNASNVSIHSTESSQHNITVLENGSQALELAAQQNLLAEYKSPTTGSPWSQLDISSSTSSDESDFPPPPVPKLIYLDELFGIESRQLYANKISCIDTQDLLDYPGLPESREAERPRPRRQSISRNSASRHRENSNTSGQGARPKRHQPNDIRKFYNASNNQQGERRNIERIPQSQASEDYFTQRRNTPPRVREQRSSSSNSEDESVNRRPNTRQAAANRDSEDEFVNRRPTNRPAAASRGIKKPFKCLMCKPNRCYMTEATYQIHCRQFHKLSH